MEVRDACNDMKATLRATKTTQINKKIYYDVLAFENGSLNRIFTDATTTHSARSHTRTHHTLRVRRKRRQQNFQTGTENTGLIIHNKVKIL